MSTESEEILKKIQETLMRAEAEGSKSQPYLVEGAVLMCEKGEYAERLKNNAASDHPDWETAGE